MYVIDRIFSYVWDLSDWFYDAYQTVRDWVWPFYLLQYPLYSLYRTTYYMRTPIAQFGDWADSVVDKIGDILSLSQIVSYFRTWIDYATDAWSWVRYAFFNVWDIVDDWWASTKSTVLGWIEAAKRYALDLVIGATNWLASLQEAWDNFKGKIPTINEVISWWSNWWGNVTIAINAWWSGRILDIQSWINSAFLEREPFWAGWQDFRDKVAQFFTDPVEFVWGLFTDWFLGPEE